MTGRIGRLVLRRDRIASTMDEVAALAERGEAEGIVVLAEEQTAGRGRAGRPWLAPPGTSILCSVLLRPPLPPDRLRVLPLVAGVAVAEAIEAVAAVACRLKWPNDVLIGERKVAGLLLAARGGAGGLDHAVLGVGINVNAPAIALPPGGGCIEEAAGRPIDRESLFVALVRRLDVAYSAYVAARGVVDLGPWRARAALLGEPVAVAVAGERREGIFVGVADDGALVLARDGGAIERIDAGELVRGPRPTAAG